MQRSHVFARIVTVLSASACIAALGGACSSAVLPVGVTGGCQSNADCVKSNPDECNICVGALDALVCAPSGTCECACQVLDGGTTNGSSDAAVDAARSDAASNDAARSDGESATCQSNADCVKTNPDDCNICVTPLNYFVCTAGGTCACACQVLDASAGSDGGAGCEPSCGAGQVCVSDQTEGGGEPFPDDAGNCPPGTVHAGDRCAPPPTYSCAPTPPACAAGLDCTCAASLCQGNFMCQSTSPGLVSCVFGAP